MNLLNILILLIFIGCQVSSSSIQTQKYYLNLRHTESSSLFTCNTKDGKPNTYRALRTSDQKWKIEAMVNADIKILANEFCKAKHGIF